MKAALLGCLFLGLAADGFGSGEADAVTVDFGKAVRPMKPLHGVNNAPMRLNGKQDEFRRAGIPFVRTHDTAGGWGGAHYVDIPNVFPDFDADENDPKSYDFAFTDAFLKPLVEAGCEPFYRLGVTIENHWRIKAYHIDPPKDFAKWARICEHVIRHYNEGWADGYRWNLRYWEIWNEPENPPMWQGDRQQFFELYRVTANHLKAKFPDLKIGGYGSCGFYAIDEEKRGSIPFYMSFVTWFEEFVRYVTAPATKAPLDFFSWHQYIREGHPADRIERHARFVRETLDAAGLASTESIFDEWNYNTEGWDAMKEMPGAATVAAAFAVMQNGSVDKAMYYDALPTRAYCGLFYYPTQRTTPCYESFYAYNVLYRLGTQVRAEAAGTNLYALAARDEKGTGAFLVVSTARGERKVRVTAKGMPDGLHLFRLDAANPQWKDEGVWTSGEAADVRDRTLLLVCRPPSDLGRKESVRRNVGDGLDAGVKPLTLARRGAPVDRSIVIAKNAAPVVRHAAEELRRYVEKLTGVSLPVADDAGEKPEKAIYLGSTRHCPLTADGLGGDGFRFQARGDDLLVSVGTTHGALFAVYDLLERYGGCEWLASGEDLVPAKAAFEVPGALDDVQCPAFIQRDTNWRDVMYDPDFAAKMKLNGPHVKYEAKHGGRDIVLLPYLTFDRLLPAKKHFDAHPEWYSLVNGRRVKDRTQLCLTNPEVLEVVTKILFAEIEKRYPETKYFDLEQNDWQNWCTCDKCRELDEREGSHVATTLSFVNAVADRVAKRWPDVVLRTFAYEYTRTAPKTLRARDNVLVTLCTDSCDCSKPMTENRNRENITFVSDLKRWRTLAKRLEIWDYSANFRCFMHTFPNFDSMPRNIGWYADEGVTHIYFEGVSRAPHMADQEFRTWMISHLLWQPKQSVQGLTGRFLRAWYGDKAVAYAARHYGELGNPPRDEAKNIIRMWGRTEDGAMPISLFDWASANWKRAEKAVRDDPVRLRRVRQAMDWADFSRIMLSNEGASMDARSVADDAHDARLAELRAAAKRIVADFNAEPDMWKFGEETGDIVMRMTRRLKCLAAETPPANPVCGRAAIEESALTRSSGASIVDDAKAENGKALKIVPTAGGWATTFHFHDIRTDPAKKYRLRARLRIERGTDPDGEAIRLGVHDGAKIAYAFPEWRLKAKSLPTDYRWLDIGEPWTPAPTTMFWFGNGDWKRAASAANPATKAIYLDKFELVEEK